MLQVVRTIPCIIPRYRYEAKSEALWRELKMCLLAVQAPLTTLYEWLVGFVDNLAQLSVEVRITRERVIYCYC